MGNTLISSINQVRQDLIKLRSATRNETTTPDQQQILDRAISLCAFLQEAYPLFGGYELRSRVVHPLYGLGTVVVPGDDEIWVKFDQQKETTRLMLRYAKIRPATDSDDRPPR